MADDLLHLRRIDFGALVQTIASSISLPSAKEKVMARAQIVYLNRRDVPVRKSLQEAVHQLGFKVTLDDSYKPFETSGYLPCTLDGEDAGFNLHFQDVAEDISPALKSMIESRDTALRIGWGGDPREQLAALAVCAALIKRFGAIVCEPNEDKIVPLDQLLARARDTQDAL